MVNDFVKINDIGVPYSIKPRRICDIAVLLQSY